MGVTIFYLVITYFPLRFFVQMIPYWSKNKTKKRKDLASYNLLVTLNVIYGVILVCVIIGNYN